MFGFFSSFKKNVQTELKALEDRFLELEKKIEALFTNKTADLGDQQTHSTESTAPVVAEVKSVDSPATPTDQKQS